MNKEHIISVEDAALGFALSVLNAKEYKYLFDYLSSLCDALVAAYKKQIKDKENEENGFCHRLPDQVSGQKFTSANICDFICYKRPVLYLIECKSVHGNTFPLADFRQYDKLKQFVGMDGVRSGVIIWFEDHKQVLYVPTKSFTDLFQRDKKSVNINKLDELEYFNIPAVQKRVFPDVDYNNLTNFLIDKEGW